ncbi:type II toxin-antitoxin system RelE/ParE family toxin [Actinomadura sp. 3N508]|uniref:type II toxin-antitoxin system RelE/ParE family toxin n=1 Tax=Actinomadura sp. 3N508 TaxID=3375153 RepID=UPI0037AA994B
MSHDPIRQVAAHIGTAYEHDRHGEAAGVGHLRGLSVMILLRFASGWIEAYVYMCGMTWDINLHPEVESWFLDLSKNDAESADLVEKAIDYLAECGPALGRPMVDRIQGSAVHNLKELRPGSTGMSEVRILFVFDPIREAILLVAGDKSGQWKRWYEQAIPLAEERYREHLENLEGGRR